MCAKKKEYIPLTYELEEELCPLGTVAGCDEAGRGPLCGPVVAAAVILPRGLVLEGLGDSKKLSEKQRERLYTEITDAAIAYSIAEASPEEIDRLNIREASMLAMNRAIEGLPVQPDGVLVDGNYARGFSMPAMTVVHGDALSPSIAAASILAKVTRDRICLELDRQYPQYGIAVHKGYPTAAHYKALSEHGPCPCHRRSFRLEKREKPDGEKKSKNAVESKSIETKSAENTVSRAPIGNTDSAK